MIFKSEVDPNIYVRVLKDSISPEGDRLFSIHAHYPRIILAEVNTHKMLCLSGDTKIEFDLPCKEFYSYKMTLKEFVTKWHNGAKKRKRHSYDVNLEDRIYTAKEISKLIKKNVSNIRSACRNGLCLVANPHKKRTEDFLINGLDYNNYHNSYESIGQDIKNRLEKMKIRIYNEDTKLIEHSTVKDCFISGIKEVYKLTLSNGFTIKCSKDHRILTDNGWKSLKDLNISEDKVIVRKFGLLEEELSDKSKYKNINGKWVQSFLKKIRSNIINKQNNVCYSENCNNEILDLHHIIPVYTDTSKAFDESNIIGLCETCHKLAHKKQDWQVRNYLLGYPVKILNIEYVGLEETYDLEINGKYHNFIANGIVVHNSKNSSSSRAVPVNNFLETIESMPFIPSFLQKNKSGMQSTEDLSEVEKKKVVKLIKNHLKATSKLIRTLSDKEGLNLHKQFVNRYSEVFQYMNTVITGSEWDSKLGTFLKLRNHQDAEPHFHELAKCIQLAYNNSKPELLLPGEWHLPFVDSQRDDSGKLIYSICNQETLTVNEVTLEEAKKISASCCAQISYRKEDNSLDKANDIFDRLIYSDPEHSSPLEHQGTPIDYNLLKDDSKKAFDIIGITHMDRLYNLWSANFKGWVMYRKELEQLNEINRLS